jgi:hypothetical protein
MNLSWHFKWGLFTVHILYVPLLTLGSYWAQLHSISRQQKKKTQVLET